MDLLEGVGAEAGLKDLLESIDDLVALATLDGRLLYVNRAWREKLGYLTEDLGQLNSYQILHPMHDDDVKKTNARLMAGEALVRVERTMIAKDGREFQVEGSVSCRFKDGKPWYVRAIFHDVTERNRVDLMKDELVSMASHELRNPLMAIQTSLQMQREDLDHPGLERCHRLNELALSNSNRMLDLINTYLDLAKLESGGSELRLRELDLRQFVSRVVELNAPLGARCGVSILQDAGPSGALVLADEDRLAQVLANLISNAVKFSKPGGAVTVTAARENGRARVGVADRGDGIPEDFRGKIFGKFQQAEGHRRGGTGLGLAISRTIVEQHGGTIGFDTKTGEGTTFWFELPVGD